MTTTGETRYYQLGDMLLGYPVDEGGHAGLMLLPGNTELAAANTELLSGNTELAAANTELLSGNTELPAAKKCTLDPLVQVKIAGDTYDSGYAHGHTLRNTETVKRLLLKEQHVNESPEGTQIVTTLEDARGYQAVHVVTWEKGARFIRCHCTFTNNSSRKISLELLSSFSLTGISPYLPGDCAGEMVVHRLQSRWSQEGRLLSQTMEELQLEPSWAKGQVRCERFGQVGSMPVNHYFPWLVLEDKKNHVFWGAQLACPSSWQMEVYRKDDNIAISGGLADREFGHWMKDLQPGESLTTPEAVLSCAVSDNLDLFCTRLTEAGERAADAGPACEQDLPVIFNEYCTTWGCPSHENIRDILQAIRGKGFSYFVIDCGWYKADGVPWDISMGDYIPSKTLFPEGLEKTTEMIRNEGLKPGIWFEIENVGPASQAWKLEEHLLHRDGSVLSTASRRFWDMQDAWVQNYLRERVIGTLKKYGFEYMKVDYNDTIGIGCDGAESLGEGLRRNMLATMDFFEEVKREVPGIILENCASGGNRLEPGFMAATSMASFSDAHECPEIPIIAANLHRAILPRQSQIWAVIRKTDSLKRIAYTMANTFLGRMCLSGDVTDLSDAQWDVIDRGIAFYKSIAPIIKKGQTRILSPQIQQMRHPKGWQGVLRTGENGEAYVLIHTFDGMIGEEIPDCIKIPLPEGKQWCIAGVYSDSEVSAEIRDGVLEYRPQENWKAVAVRLQ